MDAIYPFANVIHLLLAIAFLGYVFSDVVLIDPLKKHLPKDASEKISKLLGGKSFKIFPLSLLVIILTGGMMMSRYINSEAGVFNTPLQQLLMLKILLATIIALGVLFNLYTKFSGKSKPAFMQHHFHKLVLVLGFFIVVLAKFMFV
ncbi:MAG: hypothetical protein WCR69_07200 [Sulfuricurvum sp.]